MIIFDSTSYDTLAVCKACGWRHHAITKDTAEQAARAHLETCLPATPDPHVRQRALTAARNRSLRSRRAAP